MNYALGYAFTLSNMYEQFDKRKLSSNDYVGTKQVIAMRVFKDCVKLVVDDIINNNAVFHLPTGKRKSSIELRCFTGEKFKRARQKGKFKSIDFLATDFTGYELSFQWENRRTTTRKSIYINRNKREQIFRNAEQGLYNKIKQTYFQDYLPLLEYKYSKLKRSEIRKIVLFGWKEFYLLNLFGGDVIIKDHKFWFYSGFLFTNSLIFWDYYRKKLLLKIRVLNKRRNMPWDGYYYFALTPDRQQLVVAQQKSRGRKRTHFDYGNVFLYRKQDECYLDLKCGVYIYRVNLGYQDQQRIYKKQFISDSAELYKVIDELSLRDILVINKKYECL